MTTPRKAGPEATRVAIAGASSLLGKELKQMLEDVDFPASDIRLLDEEIVAGILTEVAGEPAVVETVDEDSFERVRIAFFTGSAGFSVRHGMQARSSGSVVIDLSGGMSPDPGAKSWIPALDALLPPPATNVPTGEPQSLFLVPSAAAQVAISLAAALAPLGLNRLAVSFFLPVSERGSDAVLELESQVVNLLSFQPIPKAVFDAQVGFNMLSAYGAESSERLSDARARIVAEVGRYLAGRIPLPAITVLQAPVFHSLTFSAYAEFHAAPESQIIVDRLEAAGLKVTSVDEEPPTNVNVVGEGRPFVGTPARDPSVGNGIWIWGAADNMRVPAATGTAIAEKLIAS